MTDHPVARRTVIKSAGLSIGAGLASGITSAHAQAAAPAAQEVWSSEYWAHKGNVKLAMFRKRLTAPAANAPQQPVLFLVHGSSNAARSSYDLTVPGKGEYFDDECVRPLRLRRVDHGPRRLRQFRQLRR
jgi:hypothetical protein